MEMAKPTRILIVEDEGIIAQDMKMRLSGMGFDVVGIAASGEKALQLAREKQPDLVLMDIAIQGEWDGIETADRIRQELDVAVIFLTAYSDQETLDRAKDLDPSSYLLKPFEEATVRIAITLALYRREAQRQIQEKERALERVNERLESRVQERTAEILQANEALCQEISEKKKAQQQLLEAKMLAEAAFESKNRFIRSMRHEIRTPLNHMMGFSELLQQQHFGALNEKQEKYLLRIRQSGQQLLKLLNEILEISETNIDSDLMERTPVNALEVVESALRLVTSQFQARNIEIEKEMPKEAQDIIADARIVKQVLYQLLMNARKMAPEGSTVKFSARQEKEAVVFSIQDAGPGIPEADKDRLFDRFVAVGGKDGAVTGLALCKHLVETQGGRIWLEDENGPGCTFSFSIPCRVSRKV